MLGVLAGDSLLAVVSRVQHRVFSPPTVCLYAIFQAVFPAGTNLGNSNFLVVFSSDKDRLDPGDSGLPVNSMGTFGWVYTKENFAALVSQINHGDGLSTVTYRAAVPFDPVNVPSWFFRLAAELR